MGSSQRRQCPEGSLVLSEPPEAAETPGSSLLCPPACRDTYHHITPSQIFAASTEKVRERMLCLNVQPETESSPNRTGERWCGPSKQFWSSAETWSRDMVSLSWMLLVIPVVDTVKVQCCFLELIRTPQSLWKGLWNNFTVGKISI